MAGDGRGADADGRTGTPRNGGGQNMNAGEFSYKEFAEQDFYQPVNTYLIEQAGIQPGQRVVDLACGTGAVTRLILERLRGARESLVIGIDMSSTALREAMNQLGNVRDVALQFIQSRVEQLSENVRERVDSVIFCNGIHMIPDKPALLSQVSASLKPGGVFAFNTSFFQGAVPQETEQFYRRWMFRSIRVLRSRHGLMPKNDKVESRRQLTPEQYAELLAQHDFRVSRQILLPTPMSLRGFLAISEYEEFIDGAMPGVPLDAGREALQEGARQAFGDLGLESVPRNWLTVVAVRS